MCVCLNRLGTLTSESTRGVSRGVALFRGRLQREVQCPTHHRPHAVHRRQAGSGCTGKRDGWRSGRASVERQGHLSRTPVDLQVEDEDEPGQREEDVPPAARLFLAGREEVGEEVGRSHSVREQKRRGWEEVCFCVCVEEGEVGGGAIGDGGGGGLDVETERACARTRRRGMHGARWRGATKQQLMTNAWNRTRFWKMDWSNGKIGRMRDCFECTTLPKAKGCFTHLDVHVLALLQVLVSPSLKTTQHSCPWIMHYVSRSDSVTKTLF